LQWRLFQHAQIIGSKVLLPESLFTLRRNVEMSPLPLCQLKNDAISRFWTDKSLRIFLIFQLTFIDFDPLFFQMGNILFEIIYFETDVLNANPFSLDVLSNKTAVIGWFKDADNTLAELNTRSLVILVSAFEFQHQFTPEVLHSGSDCLIHIFHCKRNVVDSDNFCHNASFFKVIIMISLNIFFTDK